MVYYGCKLVTEKRPLGKGGHWDYGLGEVYVVAPMDGFRMPGIGQKGEYLHDICLCDRETGEKFYEGLGHIFVELINLELGQREPQGDLQGWLYVLKNMGEMEKIPTFLRRPIFQKLFDIAEYSKRDKRDGYKSSHPRFLVSLDPVPPNAPKSLIYPKYFIGNN